MDGALKATWDLILTEAEGMSMEEAERRGLEIDPVRYALPRWQHQIARDVWVRHRGPRYPRAFSASMLWMSVGPAVYDEGVGLETSEQIQPPSGV